MKKLIEAGHYYSCDGPSNVSMKGWEIGKELALNNGALLALFVDDYHSEQGFLEEDEIFLGGNAVQAIQSEATHIFHESDIAKKAPAEIIGLLEDSKVKLKKGIVSADGVRLGAYSEGGFNSPTCTFLDYLLLCEKTKLAGNQTVVLPSAYEKQQANLSKVIAKLVIPTLSSYKSFFYNASGTDELNKVEL